MRDLSNYFYSEEDMSKIEFDKHGRPYIQNGGRLMLSKRSGYNYSIRG